MPTAVTPASPAVRELLRDLREGLDLEPAGGSHYRVIDKETGEPLRVDGKPVMVPSTPKRSGHAFENMRQNLIKAGALKPQNGSAPKRAKRRKPRPMTEEEAQLRMERMQATKSGEDRVIATKALRDRLEPLLLKAGGIERVKPADMARIAARAYEIRTGQVWALDSALTSVGYLLSGRALAHGEIERLGALADHLEHARDPRAEWFSLLREVLGLDTETLPGRNWPYKMKLVNLDQLFADYSYQRPIQEQFVRDLVLRFDERLVGVLNASSRNDGSYALIDGLQRRTAMERAGKTAAWCAVHEGLSVEQEAALFYHHNRDRKPVHPYYDYRARLVAGDPVISDIDRIVRASGFVVASQTQGKRPGERERHLAAIRSLEDIYGLSSEVREEALSPTLSVIFRNWLGRPYATEATLMRGLGRFFATFGDGEIQWEPWEARLDQIGPRAVIRRAGDLGRSSRGHNVALVLTELHNGAAKRKDLRLDPRAVGARKLPPKRLQS